MCMYLFGGNWFSVAIGRITTIYSIYYLFSGEGGEKSIAAGCDL